MKATGAWVSGVVIASALALVGCGNDGASPRVATWYGGIQPLLVGHCASCHTDGGIGPFPLDQYADASEVAVMALEAVEADIMPPWGAHETDECAPPHGWKDDPRLTADDKLLLRAWVEAGTPLGDPATALPVPPVPDFSLADASQTLEFQQPFDVPPVGPDVFECFVLDPGNTEPVWITGVQLTAGNRKVAHHALAFLDPNAESEAMATDGHFPCFSNPDVSEAKLIGAWAPGAAPFEMPESAGIPLPVGARIVIQMHYHLVGRPEIDRSSVSLRYSSQRPTYEAVLALLGNYSRHDGMADTGLMPGPNDGTEPEFVIPAGAKNHTETMVYEADLPAAIPVFAVGAHMHYVGVDMKIDHTFAGTSDQECMLQTPKWDFSWQRTYTYDAPIDELPTIRPGDRLVMRCTYDNTLDNPFIVDALTEQGLTDPVDVRLGEQTLDEMCLGIFGVLVPPGLL